MKRAIYTVILAGYDTLKPIRQWGGLDCICFTDDADLKVQGWSMRIVEPSDNPVKQQREIKLIPHKYLPEYDQTIYMDGNIELIRDPSQLLRLFKGSMMTKQHPKRNCVYQEGQACIERGKADAGLIRDQLKRYIDADVPAQGGMWETGVIIRDRSCEQFCEAWNAELQAHTHRDQISIAYAVHTTGYRPPTFTQQQFVQYFRLTPHKPKKAFRVWFSNPYDPGKDIGAALNEFCEAIPGDDDWIVLQDGDIMYLTPDWGKQIYDALARHGSDYDLIGCMTNRLGGTHQLVPGMYNERDIMKHYEVAIKMASDNYAVIEPIKQGIAGMFMCFRKSTWKKYRISEGTYNQVKFDTELSKSILTGGGKIGLMRGLYVFHLYRMWAGDNPRTDVRHLV